MAFIETGFTNWKKAKEKFKDHEDSSCHREGRQGLFHRGHDDSQENFMQLMMSKARNNSKLRTWLDKKKEK